MTEQSTKLSAIAAVSTPPGKGGVAVIRISGADALTAAEKIFFPRSGKRLSDYPVRTQVFGDILDAGDRIDDGMATFFRGPHSYTGEDTVEISCHGGVLVTGAVLQAVLATGVSMADRGEFTKRAFLSGKLSLTEAEAIGDLLDAGTIGQVKLAAGKGKDKLTSEIERIRGELIALLGSLYARIDYPDEDLGDFTAEETVEKLREVEAAIAKLLATYRTGKAVNLGVETVICGKPNAGKSTLYNALVGSDAAIVTNIPGTTRDVLTQSLPLGNVLLNLADTAGIREKTGDPIEEIGIRKSKDRVKNAELILALFDTSRPTDEEDRELLAFLAECPGEKIALLTKSDLAPDPEFDRGGIEKAFSTVEEISALAQDLDAKALLTEKVAALFTDEKISIGNDAVLSTARQNALLLRCDRAVKAAIEAFSSGVCEDAASSEIEEAVEAVSEMTGKAVSEEVVASIFSRFCVGK